MTASGSVCLNCMGDREDAPRPWCYAPEEHDEQPDAEARSDG